MNFVKSLTREKVLSFAFLILSFLLLFLGFHRNQWQMARPKKFSSFQKDVESYVLARMVVTRQSGLLAYGGLPGWGDVDPLNYTEISDADYDHQYETYLNGATFQSYWAKKSNPGFQGIFFSVLDRLSPFSPATNLRLFRILTSGLFALVLTGIIFWFLQEFGWLSAIFVLVSSLTSSWMTLFGRNLFFFSWAFYLPALVLLFRLRETGNGKQLSGRDLFWLAYGLIFFKCLFNGYDFILPTLAMAASPVIYYGVLYRWDRARFIKNFLMVVLASLLAFLSSLVVLSIQILLATGDFSSGVGFIFQTMFRRTYGVEAGGSSLANTVSVWWILERYSLESYFDRLYIPYAGLIALFAVVSLACWLIGRSWKPDSAPVAKGRALIVTLWFSLLSPLSWYSIFKSLAYYHMHMNYLPWHMPFTIFGFGLCGFAVERISGWIREKRSP
jgi:hypothetical protein